MLSDDMSSARKVRFALHLSAGLSILLAATVAPAQDAVPLDWTVPVKGVVGRNMPAIPIFYGDIYSGRLSPENGQVFYTSQPNKKYNAAYFEIYLYDNELFTYGIKSDAPIIVSTFTKETDKNGVVSWKFSGLSPTYKITDTCTIVAGAKKAGEYRIELKTEKPDIITDYRFFIQPSAVPSACNSKLGDEAKAMFAGPGHSASLEIAKSWLGRERPLTRAIPEGHIPPETASALAYAESKPEVLRSHYLSLYIDGEHNAVLNFANLGLAAMETGFFGDAEWAFDQALAGIEMIYRKDAVAESARSARNLEAIKDFKGEPYERAMVYYYRGLLYLRAGDYENARATFKAGEYQDTISEKEQFQGDFALLTYLSGWASYCINDMQAADEAFALARQINPKIALPDGRSTLVLADVGQGPVKMRRGNQGQLLTFVHAVDSGRNDGASLVIPPGKSPSKAIALTQYSDIHFQATTRGGRAFDAILDGQAVSKTAFYSGANIGQHLMNSGNPLGIGAGFIMALAGKGLGGGIKPQADIRMWAGLPDHVAVAPISGNANASYSFRFEAADRPAVERSPLIQSQQGRCGLIWGRSRTVLDFAGGAAGNDKDIVEARAKKPEAVERDRRFREVLAGY